MHGSPLRRERSRLVRHAFTVLVIFAAASHHARADYRETNVANGGTINGRVWFPQEYPPRERIRISADPGVCGASRLTQDFVVDEETRGFRYVVVSLVDIAAGKALEFEITDPETDETRIVTLDDPVYLDQKGCAYVPHVQVAFPSSKLVFRNNDGILHNVHTYFEDGTLFNIAQPGALKEFSQDLPEFEGVVTAKCDVHTWMNSYVVLVEHPYYAVTDKDGKYTLTDVPPGTYKIQAWHEVMGEMEKEVTVVAGETVTLDYELLPE